MPVAIVTGAGRKRGIGQGIAAALADRGFNIALNDLEESDEAHELLDAIRTAGRLGMFVAADIRTAEENQRLVSEVVAELGQLDVFVANAGVARWARLTEATPDEWDDVFDVNLHGAFFGCRAASEEMRRTGGGSIVVTSSITGLMPFTPLGFYAASKFAIAYLVGVMAREWGPYGITVNHVVPGWVDSDINHDSPENDDPQSREALFTSLPVGHRAVEPREIGDAVAYLVGARMTTGASIRVDGGLIIGKY